MATQETIRLRRLEIEAEGYLELGMPDHALTAVHRMETMGRLSPHALLIKGHSHFLLDHFEEAVIPLEQAAVLIPNELLVWLSLGWCYKRTGRLDRAIHSLEEGIRLLPAQGILYYNLACYLSLTGRKQEALHHLATALMIEPKFRDEMATESDFDLLRTDPVFQELASIIV